MISLRTCLGGDRLHKEARGKTQPGVIPSLSCIPEQRLC